MEEGQEKKALARRVWNAFRSEKVFADNQIDSKNGKSYLKWSSGFELMNKHFPDNDVSFSRYTSPDGYDTEVMYFPDGTGQVTCTITIREDGDTFQKTMWLPIIDHRNKPVVNPNSFAINTAKMRCAVKCLAIMGLGLHVYQGADCDPVYVPEMIEELCKTLDVSEGDLDKYLKGAKIVPGGLVEVRSLSDGNVRAFCLFAEKNINKDLVSQFFENQKTQQGEVQ